MNKRLLNLAIALSACATPVLAQTTYTWTGAADPIDGDWTNTANWDANGIPVDDNDTNAQLTLNITDQIVFDGSNMPTLNIPSMNSATYVAGDSGSESTPALVLNSGGILNLTSVGDIWTNDEGTNTNRTVFTVGDGTGAAGEVTLVNPGTNTYMRHANGTHNFLINSDGIYIDNGNSGRWAWNGTSRLAVFTINGGSVIKNGTLGNAARFHAGAVVFSAIGGTFKAQFGNAFPDLASVEAELGAGKDFQSSDPLSIELSAEDNLDGTFTVTAVTPPDPNYWSGSASNVLGGADENFTLNNAADPLDEGSLADLIALPVDDKATFDDNFFFDNTSSPVAQSALATVAGGVSIETLSFIHSTTNYSINSVDANGISGATNIDLIGTGSLTLTGDHSTTGNVGILTGTTLNIGDGSTNGSLTNAAISIDGAIVYDVSTGTVAQTGAISGTGTLDKQGSGELTIAVGSAHNGAVNVAEGTLVYTGNHGSNNINIASGATLELEVPTFLNAPNTTFTGTGTLIKTGVDQIRWAGQAGIFQFGSDALIDVQEGTFRAGSNANEDWSANLSDLNIASGASFNTHEANVVIDALSGAGTLGSGFNGAGYTHLTIGIDNGSGTFTGVILDQDGTVPCSIVKEGTGTQVFDGYNTYTGNTTVNGGVLTFGEFCDMWFVPLGSGTTNQINGSAGTVNLEGLMIIDLTNTVAAPGASWTLVDTSGGLTANSNLFDVGTQDEGVFFTNDDPGIWTLDQGIGTYTYTEATGVLSFSVAAGSNLWTGVGGATWDQATTANFTNNEATDPLDNVTFDTATATSLNAIFADEYFADSSAIAATNTDITIGTGGVQITGGSVTFANVNTPFTITSSDTIGITGDTAIDVVGNITIAGTHTTTGTTTVGGGVTLTFDAASAPSSYSSPLAGGGSIVKTGADVVSITADAAYTGSTTVSEGTLQITNNSDTTGVSIASGATLEIDFGGRWGGAAIFSGTGTLAKTGTGNLDFLTGNFQLEPGSLIDVQSGTFTGSSGGSGGSETWTNNMSDLTVASGATFNGVEGNIRIDELNGDGTFSTGFGSAGYVSTVLGVDNGDGTFNGVIIDNNRSLGHIGSITKIGTGTQTLGGFNTYTGNTVVEDGTLIVSTTGALTFAPVLNGAINTVSGTALGTVTLEGTVNFNFVDADTTPGNSWVIIDNSLITFSYGAGLMGVSGDGDAFSPTGTPGIWELDAAGNLWTYNEATYTLSVAEGTAVVDEDGITSDEFEGGFVFDGTDSNFSFSVNAGKTYEIRCTDDLTTDLATWTTVYGPTAATEGATITPSVPASADPQAFYVLLITETVEAP
ncbi:MAG: beta strand repeat-containing protein [Opitutaceae bacterium]